MWRSKTSTCAGSVVALAIALVLAGACSKKRAPVAELVKAEGPVDRQQGSGAWTPAQVGTQYFVGDAARTADAPCQLEIGRSAQITMQGHTVLRFSDKGGTSQIAVEVGAIDFTGTGSYTLDVGELKLSRNGTVRITAKGQGADQFELTGGEGQLAAQGQRIDLVLGKPVELGLEVTVTDVIDAAVRDAPAVVVADAAAPDAASDVADVMIEVTGKHAEVLAAGDTAWKPLAAGSTTLARGSAIRTGAGTTAKLVAGATTLELAGGSRAVVQVDLSFALELGSAKAAATGDANVALPGGSVAMTGSATARGEAKLDMTGHDTTVSVLRGSAKLAGSGGAELAMNRGESAKLAKAGTIRVLEAIPNYFDLRATVGETLTVHDPKPPTAIQLVFDGKCPEGGIIEVDRDARFHTPRVSGGKDRANVMLSAGAWAYRLRCTQGAGEGPAVAAGRIAITRDDGRRPLPKNPPGNDIDLDGRNYRISYQGVIPNVTVHVTSTGGSTFKLHLASGGKEQTFDATTPNIAVAGSQLHEGAYTLWIERDGVKQDRITNLTIDFDQTAPQVYIESPPNGQPWSGEIDVRGAVLPGWTAAVDGVTIPIDKQRRFAAQVGRPAGNALAIRLAHPQHGVHVYLRREK